MIANVRRRAVSSVNVMVNAILGDRDAACEASPISLDLTPSRRLQFCPMADVSVSSVCSNYDPAAGGCRLNGAPCPHSAAGDFTVCPDATFLARVSMPPDEFVVVLNAAGEPTLGTLTVIRCRRPEFHHAA